MNKSLSKGKSKTARAVSCISSKQASINRDDTNYANNINASVKTVSKAEEMLQTVYIILKQNDGTISRQ